MTKKYTQTVLFAKANGSLGAARAGLKQAKSLRKKAHYTKHSLPDGFYVLYGLKHSMTPMSNIKAAQLATESSMRKTATTRIAGEVLLHVAEVAIGNILNVDDSTAENPTYIKAAGEDDHWVCYGPLSQDFLEVEDRREAWEQVYNEISLQCNDMPSSINQVVVEVDNKVRRGHPSVWMWSDNSGSMNTQDNYYASDGNDA